MKSRAFRRRSVGGSIGIVLLVLAYAGLRIARIIDRQSRHRPPHAPTQHRPVAPRQPVGTSDVVVGDAAALQAWMDELGRRVSLDFGGRDFPSLVAAAKLGEPARLESAFAAWEGGRGVLEISITQPTSDRYEMRVQGPLGLLDTFAEVSGRVR